MAVLTMRVVRFLCTGAYRNDEGRVHTVPYQKT